MAMFERKLFNKPIAVTKQDMPSGVSSDITTGTPFFTIPWNKLGYLKRIEIGRHCDRASGCLTFEIWDNFVDLHVPWSGFEKRKEITIPDATAQMNWDETEDIPLLGMVYGFPSISGVDVTITCRTM